MKQPKFYNFPQYSEEWWKTREKKMTASHAQAIGSNGKGLETYIRQIMAEYYSSATPDTFSNSNMSHGLETEHKPAEIYAWEYSADVQEVGFVVYSDFVGCSPDRLVDDDGLLEIKCPTDKVYFELLLTGKIDTKYLWQMQMQMFVCQRSWCDYVVFNANFEQNMFVKRVLPDPAKIEKLEAGFKSGEEMILEIAKKMENAA